MKKYILLIALNVPVVLFAQIRQVTDPVVNNQFGYLSQVPAKPANVVGSVYLNENWKETTVNLKKEILGISQLVGINVMVDLKSNTLEVKTDKDIKVLNASNVNSFTWRNDVEATDETYINCDKYSLDGTKLHGFGRLVAEGEKLSLIRHEYVEFIRSDYNVTLDVGSKDHKFVKKNKLYFLKDHQFVAANKKSIMAVMGDKKQQVSQYAKDNKLNTKNERDLGRLVAYYNTL